MYIYTYMTGNPCDLVSNRELGILNYFRFCITFFTRNNASLVLFDRFAHYFHSKKCCNKNSTSSINPVCETQLPIFLFKCLWAQSQRHVHSSKKDVVCLHIGIFCQQFYCKRQPNYF